MKAEPLVEGAPETLDLDVLNLPGSPAWCLERLDTMRRRGDITDADYTGAYMARALVHGLKAGLLSVERVRAIPWDTQTNLEGEIRLLLIRTGVWASFVTSAQVPEWMREL